MNSSTRTASRGGKRFDSRNRRTFVYDAVSTSIENVERAVARFTGSGALSGSFSYCPPWEGTGETYRFGSGQRGSSGTPRTIGGSARDCTSADLPAGLAKGWCSLPQAARSRDKGRAQIQRVMATVLAQKEEKAAKCGQRQIAKSWRRKIDPACRRFIPEIPRNAVQ